MPLFEYRCEACGAEFEELVGPGETARCPRCGGERLKKLLSAFATSAKRAPAGACGGCGFAGDCGGHAHGAGCGCGCAGHRH